MNFLYKRNIWFLLYKEICGLFTKKYVVSLQRNIFNYRLKIFLFCFNMDFKAELDSRHDYRKNFIFLNDNKYDYEKNGILTKTLPKIFFKGNSILVTFLQFIDMRIIMLFKYIDKLKNFKNITDIY